MTHITRFSFILDVFDLYSMYKLVNNIEKSIVGLFTRKPLDSHIKGSKGKCKNYRGIILLSIPWKVFVSTLPYHINAKLLKSRSLKQSSFMPGR